MNADSLEVKIQTQVGHIYRRKGLETAEQRFERALEIDPNCFEAHLGLGQRYRARHDYNRAAEEFEIAVSSRPNDAEAHAALGDVYYAQGREEDALSEYKHIKDNTTIAFFILTP